MWQKGGEGLTQFQWIYPKTKIVKFLKLKSRSSCWRQTWLVREHQRRSCDGLSECMIRTTLVSISRRMSEYDWVWIWEWVWQGHLWWEIFFWSALELIYFSKLGSCRRNSYLMWIRWLRFSGTIEMKEMVEIIGTLYEMEGLQKVPFHKSNFPNQSTICPVLRAWYTWEK